MYKKVLNIIKEETLELLEDKEIDLATDSSLFGQTGLLDSMGLVMMIVAVEQDIEDEFDVQITIADAKAMSQKNSPFKTIGTLADYIISLIEEEKNG